jgi:hypothetical protein
MEELMNDFIDWSNFNSSLIIEVETSEGIATYTGVAVTSFKVLTSEKILHTDTIRMRVSTDMSYNPKGVFYEVENAECLSGCIAKLTLKTPLPDEIKIYPLWRGKFEGHEKFYRVGFGLRQRKKNRTLITPQFKKMASLNHSIEFFDQFSYDGDIGGPIFIQNNGQLFLAAIHSSTHVDKMKKISKNAMVSSHREWILS